MPTYEYACTSCGNGWEEIQKISEDPLKVCPKCGQETAKRMISGGDAATEWNAVMATAMLAMIPPALVVLLMQRWFVKGLVDTEK